MKNGIINKAKMRRRLLLPLVGLAMLLLCTIVKVRWVISLLFLGAAAVITSAALSFSITCIGCGSGFNLRMSALFGDIPPICPHCGMTYRVE